MKRKTKRFAVTLALAAFAAILILFLSACFPGPDDYEEFVLPEFTDVEYSPDGKSITIYLDGSAPVRNSRAINLKLAQIGYDFFEVAFMSGSTVVRSVWETGHAAGISGVVRGVDYALAVPGGAGSASAILFVGKRSDKTLLALGKLTGTSDPTNVGPTFVSADTKSVTFTVAALDIGASFSGDESSFQTAARSTAGTNPLTNINANNTEILPVMIGRQLFPLYRFNRNALTTGNQGVYARYTFKVYDPPNDGFATMNNTFLAGIRQAGPAILVELGPDGYHLEPRYPRGDGTWATSSLLVKDDNTVIAFRNNLAANNNNPFQNPVDFTFNTRSANNGKIFAFSFQIPVYPLTNTGNPGTWYLRPGYDSYLYDLDDGKGGTGGAMLIGTGELGDSLSFNLKVQPPYKNIYPDNSAGGTGYIFWTDGIKVNLRVGNDEISYIHENLFSDPPDSTPPKPVKFYIGTGGSRVEILPNVTNLQSLLVVGGNPNPLYVDEHGMVEITVEYFDPNTQAVGDDPYQTQFTIGLYLSGGTPDSDMIPEGNRKVIASQNGLNGVMNTLTPGNYIFVFYDSFNIPPVNLQTGNYYIIIIAAKPDLVVGKSGNTDNGFTVSGSAVNSTFYLGLWPFNDTLSVQGLAIASYPLTINAGTGGGYFLNNNVAIDVVEGPGFRVIGNETYFIRNP
jgi:hypothetical protein